MLFAGRQVQRQGVLLTLVLLATLVFLSACSFFFAETSRVERAVVDDVRNIGGIVAETTSEYYWDGVTAVTDVMVADTRVPDSRKALERRSSYWKIATGRSTWNDCPIGCR